MRLILLCSILLVLLAPLPVRGGEGWTLEGPRVLKTAWESGLLREADLDGDGDPDFILANNAKKRLEMYLRQGPEAGGPRFERRERVLEGALVGLECGDFDGDGRVDLALLETGKPVVLVSGREGGEWSPPRESRLEGLRLLASDLDGDGVADLMTLDRERLSILHGGGEAFARSAPLELEMAALPSGLPLVADFDGDGLADLLYQDAQRPGRMVWRPQRAPRRWGLERALEAVPAADMAALRAPEAAARLALLDGQTGALRLYRLSEAVAPEEREGWRPGEARLLSLGGAGAMAQASLALGDVNGDGRADLLAASPDFPELRLFLQDDEGRLQGRRRPALADIRDLVLLEAAGGGMLFYVSGEEKALAYSRWQPDEEALSLAQPLETGGEPLAIATADFDGSGAADLLCLRRPAEGPVGLILLRDPAGGDGAPQPEPLALPEGLELEPTGLRAADLDGDGLCDLIVFRKYEPTLLLFGRSEGGFAAWNAQGGLADGLLDRLTPATLELAQLDGSDGLDLLATRETFVRAYRFETDEAGARWLKPLAQWNGRNPEARIRASRLLPALGEEPAQLVLLDEGNDCLSCYPARPDAGVESARHFDLEGLGGERMLVGDLDGSGRPDLLLQQGRRLQLLYAGGGERRLQLLWNRETDVPDGRYRRLFALDQGRVLGLLEGSEHLLELLRLPSGGPEESPDIFFRFKVFDDAGRSGGQPRGAGLQPREALLRDFSGDGLADLLLLAHEHLLFYPASSESP